MEGIGAHDDFFEMGGHSLLATQVIARVREVFGVEVPLGVLFDEPTVRGLAGVIGGTERGLAAPPVLRVSRDQVLPLSFGQQRLWFLDRWSRGRRSTTCRWRCGWAGGWVWRRWGRRWAGWWGGMRCADAAGGRE